MAQVLVTSIGKGMQPKRMQMCAALWAQGVKAEFGYKAAPTIKDALGYADDNGIPFVVLFGESELASASVKVCTNLGLQACCDVCTRAAQPTSMGALHSQPEDVIASCLVLL